MTRRVSFPSEKRKRALSDNVFLEQLEIDFLPGMKGGRGAFQAASATALKRAQIWGDYFPGVVQREI